ncbi:unnamed protein product, partial [Closterium sp. Yama58-4]
MAMITQADSVSRKAPSAPMAFRSSRRLVRAAISARITNPETALRSHAIATATVDLTGCDRTVDSPFLSSPPSDADTRESRACRLLDEITYPIAPNRTRGIASLARLAAPLFPAPPLRVPPANATPLIVPRSRSNPAAALPPAAASVIPRRCLAHSHRRTDKLHKQHKKQGKHEEREHLVKVHVEEAKEALIKELAKIRTGRAAPGLLDHVHVEAYGRPSPLSRVATVTVKDPQLLSVTLHDASLLGAAMKGLQESPMGLNPSHTSHTVILVPIPKLTKEVREAMFKLAQKAAESARVSLRRARKE